MIEAAPISENGTSQLIRIYESLQTGNVQRQVLLESRPSTDPKQSIDRFHIVGFDSVNGNVYFETPAWATSSAIWAVNWPIADWTERLKPWLITDGSLVGTSIASDIQRWDILVEKGEIEEGRGRVRRLYTYKANGTRVCEVKDTPGVLLSPACITRP